LTVFASADTLGRMHTTESSTTSRLDIEGWFRSLERCVRTVDYASGRTLFSTNVVAFGTKADVVGGLANLEANQWSGVWPTIRDFTFQLDQLHWGWSGDSGWAVVTWTSTGFTIEGQPFPRPGRATVVFSRVADRLVALHSHFSLAPGTPQRSYGTAN
jgi:ketosteroid isomerase-like protein